MRSIFRRLGVFIENKRLLLIALCLVLIAPAVYGAAQLKMETGIETFMSTSSEIYQDFERFNEHFSSDVIVVLVTGDDISELLQSDNFEAMGTVESQMGENSQIISALGPNFLIEQAMAQQADMPSSSDDSPVFQDIVMDQQTGEIRDNFRQVFPDSEHAIIAITLQGGLSHDTQKDIVQNIEKIVDEAGFVGVETIVTGEPAIWGNVSDMMLSGMRDMLIVSVVLMFLILALVFSVRGFFAWRWLPILIVFIAVAYAFGIMGALNIPITMATMAVFPIMVGLGVDYGIQFHNRYDEEARRGKKVTDAIIETVGRMGPSVGMALIVVCLGFAALFFSPVPMIKDFGLMLIVGVTGCYLLSTFLLLAILHLHDRRMDGASTGDKKIENHEPDRKGFVENGLHHLAPWVIKNPIIILPIALLFTVAGVVADFHIEAEVKEINFISQDVPVIQNVETLDKIAGSFASMNLLVEADDVTDPEVLEWMLQAEQHIAAEQANAVTEVNSIADQVVRLNEGQIPQDSVQIKEMVNALPNVVKRNLVTDDYTAANIILSLEDAGGDGVVDLREALTQYVSEPPDGVDVSVTGMSVVRTKLFGALTGGRMQMNLIGVALVFLGLLALFRFNLLKALIAILPIALIVGWSSGLMFLAGIKFTPLTATLGALIIGIGVEFTVLLMTRYYEERENGIGPAEAMTIAMAKIGRAIIATGLTTIGGFAALLIAGEFVIIRDFGIITLLDVTFALISTLLVLPTLIVWIDSWREKRRLTRTNSGVH